MSAGGFLEIPAFVIGVGGLTAVYDKICAIWKTVAQAGDFGEEIATIFANIEMEYYKFEMWWTVMVDVINENDKGLRFTPKTSFTHGSLLANLQSSISNQFLNAAVQILNSFDKIEKVLKKNGALNTAVTAQALPTPAQPSSGVTWTTTIASRAQMRHADKVKLYLRGTPFLARALHFSKPWDNAGHLELKKEADNITHWNNQLLGILPQRLRDFILEQGLGLVLNNPQSIKAVLAQAHAGTSSPLGKTINLVILRQQTKAAAGHDRPAIDVIKEMSRDSGVFKGLPETRSSHNSAARWSRCEHTASPTAGTKRVLIEWYTCPQGLLEIAKERVARLAFLLQPSHKPPTLRTLCAIGTVLSPHIDNTIGLVSDFPPNTNATFDPVSLYSLLSQTPGHRTLPTQEQRMRIASTLSETLYTFLLARWHHKRFISDNVVFLYGTSPTPIALPDLENPYVSGFGLSRPESLSGVSFPLFRAAEFEIYLHPLQLQALAMNREPPKARAAFDIYGFGLMLAEIGFWNKAANIAGIKRVSRNSGSGEIRRLVISKCESDLACWAGRRYRDVVLRCLRAEDVADGGVGEDLSDFFDVVVGELAKCCEDWVF